jgi:hypothetical protein
VVLLSSAGVSSRLKDPRSALAGAIVGLLLLFRVEEEEEERKLDSTHAQQRGKHWIIISQVYKTKKENLWRCLSFIKGVKALKVRTNHYHSVYILQILSEKILVFKFSYYFKPEASI